MANWLQAEMTPTTAMECFTDYPDLDEVMNAAVESYVYTLMVKDDSDADFFAMEGVTVDAVKILWSAIKETRELRKAMNKAKKEGRMGEAAKNAKAVAKKLGELDTKVGKLPDSVSSAAIVNIALAIAAIAAVGAASYGLSKAGGALGGKAGGALGSSEKAKNVVRKGTSTKVKAGQKKRAKWNVVGKAYDAAERRGLANAAATDFANNARAAGKKIGTVAGASIPGALAGGTAIGAFLKKKNAIKEKGNLSPNDVNALIQIVRSTLKAAQQHYLNLAKSFTAAKEAYEYIEAGYDPAIEGEYNLLDALMSL